MTSKIIHELTGTDAPLNSINPGQAHDDRDNFLAMTKKGQNTEAWTEKALTVEPALRKEG